MKLCKYHQRLLERALTLLGDDCFYSFVDALIAAFVAHFQHHCPQCHELKQGEKK